MKKIFVLFLAMLLLCTFVSCDDKVSKNTTDTLIDTSIVDADTDKNTSTNETQDTHSHLFNKKSATEEFLKSSATCNQPALYYYSCSCGEKGSSAFEHGDALTHIVADDACTLCKKKATHDLKFQINDNQTYTVCGIGSVPDSDIIIPSKHNGLDVVTIADMAFENCMQIKKIVLPETLKTIGFFAFADCKKLSEIRIPKNVENLASTTFVGCSALKKITVDSGNSVFYSDGNCVIETARKLLKVGIQTSVIPCNENVTTIAENAFGDCIGLSEIVIPSNITKIQSMAFGGCSSLQKITLSNSIAYIGDSTFADCKALKEIVFQGTKAEWDAVVKKDYWDDYTGNYKLTFHPDTN